MRGSLQLVALLSLLVGCTSLLPPLPRHTLLRIRAGRGSTSSITKASINAKDAIDNWNNAVDDYDDSNFEDDESFTDVIVQKLQQNTVVASFIDAWAKTPPLTQSFLAASVAITFLSFVYNNNQFPSVLTLQWSRVFRNFEVWRIFTNFLNFGSFDAFYALTIYILWMNMSVLEKLHARVPEEFLVLMGFGSIGLLMLHAVFNITPVMLGHNLLTYMIYIWSRLFEGTDINLYGFIMKAEWLPWIYCLETVLFQGAFPIADAFSIFVGHLYLYMKDGGLLRTPQFLRKLFSFEFLRRLYAKFRDDVIN